MAAQELNFQSVIEWLDAGAPPAQGPQEVLKLLCNRLVDQGLPLHRVAVFVRTLHPNVAGRGFIWHGQQNLVEVVTAEIGIQDTEQYLKSPVRIVFTQNIEVRSRIEGREAPLEFPILDDLRKEGATDFFAVPIRFINGEVHGASFVTRQRGGFTDAQTEAIRRVMPAFSRVAEIYAWKRTARNILDAYLGEQTGEKVLAGKIRRGDGEDIRAVIWFCDLRDSTPLAESMSREAFLHLLNEYFECILGPVQERGGEILRFIGDAALAIFPIGNDPASVACSKALDAANQAVSRMEKFNSGRETPLRFGIGLHLGLVLYGNIGTPTRIEFTVIGAAANEAARIEGLCKTLNVDVTVSENVARHLPSRLRSLGRHPLRGVSQPVEIFSL